MNERRRLFTFVVMFSLLTGIIGFSIGWGMGAVWALNWGLEKAVYFLDLKNISVEVNTHLLADGIYRYQNQIGGCWNFDAFNYSV